MHLLHESLVGKCEYTTLTTGSFQCHVIDAKRAVLLLTFVSKSVLVLYLSFSFRYLVELKLQQNLKNEATWAQIWMILKLNRMSRLIRCGKLSCTEFCSGYLDQCLSIDLFPYWTPDRGQEGPMNNICPGLLPGSLFFSFFWSSAWCQVLMWSRV